MTDNTQLPYILRLLDDDSEEVEKAVGAALADYGNSLTWALSELREPPEEWQIKRIRELLDRHRKYAGDGRPGGHRRPRPRRPGGQ